MDEKSSSKSIEYVENDFSTLNAHVDGILYNEKQISRLKKYRVDRVRIKQFGLIALILGILAILLAIAYHWFKAPVIRTIEVEVPKIVEVAVPRDVVKKEVVHYPIFTNDPDYLRFSKTKFTDLVGDKDKKKKDDE